MAEITEAEVETIARLMAEFSGSEQWEWWRETARLAIMSHRAIAALNPAFRDFDPVEKP
jgi:hypothetical protein